MVTYTYVAAMPVAGDPPRVDQPVMTMNSQYLQAFAGKDHNFSTNSGSASDGYHTVAHWVNQGGDPAFINTIVQLYAKNGELWFRDGTSPGTVAQLTMSLPGNATINSASIGLTYLPGGIIVQYATITPSSSGSGTAYLWAGSGVGKLGGQSFPTNCYGIVGSLSVTGSLSSDTVAFGNITKLGFTAKGTTSKQYFIIAFGN